MSNDEPWALAISLYESAQYEEAIPIFQSLLGNSPPKRQIQIFQALGVSHVVLGRFNEASRCFYESKRITRENDLENLNLKSSKPLFYIHIPKTAGTSLQTAMAISSESLRHRWVEFEKTPDDHYYPFDYPSNILITPSQLKN